MATSRRVLLKGRPVGEPRVEDFEVEDAPVPEPGPGQLLLRTIYLSLDPYMRGRMNEGKSYAGRRPRARRRDGGRNVSARCGSRAPDASRRRPRGSAPIGWRVALGLDGDGLRSRPHARRRSPPRSACSACRASRPTSACSTSAGRRPGETVVRLGRRGRGGLGGRADRQDQGLPRDRRRRRRGPSASTCSTELGFDACRRLQEPGRLRGSSGWPVRTASTSTSTTWAAPCSTR